MISRQEKERLTKKLQTILELAEKQEPIRVTLGEEFKQHIIDNNLEEKYLKDFKLDNLEGILNVVPCGEGKYIVQGILDSTGRRFVINSETFDVVEED